MRDASLALRVWSAILVALVGMTLAAGCESDLSADMEGKECDSEGACLPGYVCDGESNLCIKRQTEENCREGETICGGMCVVLSSNANHCGACGTECTAPANARPWCAEYRCRLYCNDDFLTCGDVCVDAMSDLQHCGGCGIRCPTPDNGSPTCIDGECGVECDEPYLLCDGRCLDVSCDPKHCGDCDTECGAGQVCDDGVCGDVCSGGRTNCGGSCVDIDSTMEHCGACDAACLMPTHGRGVCTDGQCSIE